MMKVEANNIALQNNHNKTDYESPWQKKYMEHTTCDTFENKVFYALNNS